LIVKARTFSTGSTRLLLVLASVAVLILSLFSLVRPTQVAGGNGHIEFLHQAQVDSTDPGDQEEFEDCSEDEVRAGQVLWHFLLNQVDPGITSALEIHAQFTNSGDLHDLSNWVPPDGGQVHHFFIFTTGDDVLTDAWVNTNGSDAGLLNLSHFCRGEEEESPSPSPTPEGSQGGSTSTPAPSKTPEGSQGGGTGTPDPSRTPEGSQLGATGTPAASLLNTALSLPSSGTLATIFFGAVLISALGALAYANAVAVRRRR
jgi:hypothetical protein